MTLAERLDLFEARVAAEPPQLVVPAARAE
jgi:hypothetical protein